MLCLCIIHESEAFWIVLEIFSKLSMTWEVMKNDWPWKVGELKLKFLEIAGIYL